MNERELIHRKCSAKGYQSVSELVRGLKSEITQETWGAFLNRGDNVNLRTLLKMCIELECSVEEVTAVLTAQGETLIANWVHEVAGKASHH